MPFSQRIKTKGKFSYNLFFTFLLVSRFLSEIITNFFWDRANYIWSSLALIGIFTSTWLVLVPEVQKEKKLFGKYWPILLYLSYLFLRVDWADLYSIKCFFSEFIVLFIFILVLEISSRNFNAMMTVQVWTIRFVKINIIIGIAQILIFSLSTKTINPIEIFDNRFVSGIYAHPNIFLVMTLPFLFYFTKKELYHWIPLLLIACLGTGTRAPFLALLCMSIIIYKSVFSKRINWNDIFLTLVIIGTTYFFTIMFYGYDSGTTYYDSSRFAFGSLQWRIDFWSNFFNTTLDISTLFGNGVGSADLLSGSLLGQTISYPHNDYLRVYYDTGLIGILFFITLIIFFIRLIMNSITIKNDFVLLCYLLIISFYITDNFIYHTNPMYVYIFIAVFLSNPKKPAAINEDFIS